MAIPLPKWALPGPYGSRKNQYASLSLSLSIWSTTDAKLQKRHWFHGAQFEETVVPSRIFSSPHKNSNGQTNKSNNNNNKKNRNTYTTSGNENNENDTRNPWNSSNYSNF